MIKIELFKTPTDTQFWADLIERFIAGRMDSPYEWDDYINLSRTTDLMIKKVQRICNEISEIYPDPKEYCSPDGTKVLLSLAEALRAGRECTLHFINRYEAQHS